MKLCLSSSLILNLLHTMHTMVIKVMQLKKRNTNNTSVQVPVCLSASFFCSSAQDD